MIKPAQQWSTLSVVAALLIATGARGEELRRNPFLPPADVALAAVPLAADGRTTSKPVVRGIMHAGERSLVNLNGTVIAIGEEAAGYRLLSVNRDTAVFSRGNEIIRVNLYEDENTD